MHNIGPNPWPYERFHGRTGDPPAERDRKNADNVALYWSLTPKGQRILHIGAGDNPYPGSLAEDVEQYNDDRYPQLLALVGSPIDQYLPAGETFDQVIVVNIKNFGRSTDYEWVFQVAGPVMKRGASLLIAAWQATHDSIAWVISQERTIAGLGFSRVSPVLPGQYEDAQADIKALPATAWGFGHGMVSFPMTNAVQIVWQKA